MVSNGCRPFGSNDDPLESVAMTARLRSFLLVPAMVWQAMARLTPGEPGLGTQEVVNLLSHAQDLDHHHHQDRSLRGRQCRGTCAFPCKRWGADGWPGPDGPRRFSLFASISPLLRVSDAFRSVTPEGLFAATPSPRLILD